MSLSVARSLRFSKPRAGRRPNGSVQSVVSARGTGKRLGQTLIHKYSCPQCRRIVLVQLDSPNSNHRERWYLCSCGHFIDSIRDRVFGVYKFCGMCDRILPADTDHFANCDGHRSTGVPTTSTGLSGNCLECKNIYNHAANKYRQREQHIEAREARELMNYLLPRERMPIQLTFRAILQSFHHRCFKCRTRLTMKTVHWDHTRPLSLGWSLDAHATPLCAACNGQKGDKWPSEFYSDEQLKELASLTGLTRKQLTKKTWNPSFITRFYEEYETISARWPTKVARIEGRLARQTKITHHPKKLRATIDPSLFS